MPARPRPPRAPAVPPRRAVPVFTLYGEPDGQRDLEFVHLETIAARSQRYQWEIASHTHRGLFQLLVLFEGGATVQIDDRTLTLRPPAAITLPAAVVHAFRFQPGSRGSVLTVADALLSEADDAQQRLFAPLRNQPRQIDLAGDPETTQRIADLLIQLETEFRGQASGRHQMFDWLVRAILLLVARSLSYDTLSEPARGRATLFERFGQLVERHYADHWAVTRYAAALNLTESRLNRLCQSTAGKSAFDVMQDRLLLEARRKLTYIEAPVAQLAYELGFADPAYFCRFFKRHTGMAPTVYRRRGAGGRPGGPTNAL